MKFSVVLPCYNEERYLKEAVTKIEAALSGIEYEIIIVDDGSTDRTLREALLLEAQGRVKLISYAMNKGKGEAIIIGLRAAIGEAVGHIDGDLDISPERLLAYIKALDSADIAVASKRHQDSVIEWTVERRFLSWGFQKFIKVMVGIDVSDTQTGMKVARRESIERILPFLAVKRYAFDVELLTVARLMDMKVIEFPIELSLTSSFGTRNIGSIFIEVLGIAYRLRIKHWYQKAIKLREV